MVHLSIPGDYGATLKAIQQRVQQERARVILSANAALIQLYWDIGRLILDRQSRSGWGAKVIDRLGRDLRKSFPEMQGFSIRNLQFMRTFAEEFSDTAIMKQLASQLPWWRPIPRRASGPWGRVAGTRLRHRDEEYDELVESEDERLARESEKAFERAITRVSPD